MAKNEGSLEGLELCGVYSNRQILAAIELGHIIFRPFVAEHINGASIDVTLGDYYYRTERVSDKPVYNPFDRDDVEHYFGDVQMAVPVGQWLDENGLKPLVGYPDDQLVIPLDPGERILGHTHEFIGIKAPGVPAMQARSTWGRNGLDVCLAAGWGDPGWGNRWTMEIYNFNSRRKLLLPVGERIAQIVLYATGPVDGRYDTLSGKYQESSIADIDDMIKLWTPDQMLPKAYKDKRRQPIPLIPEIEFSVREV